MQINPKKIYIIILSVTFLWNLCIFLAPVFADRSGIFIKTSSLIYWFFSTSCHQIDERSFHLYGHKLAVCSRCISIYLSFLLGVILYPVFYKLNNVRLPSIWYLLISAFIVFLDAALNLLGIIENTFFTRTISGILIGVVLPFYLIPGFINLSNEVYIYFFNKN